MGFTTLDVRPKTEPLHLGLREDGGNGNKDYKSSRNRLLVARCFLDLTGKLLPRNLNNIVS